MQPASPQRFKTVFQKQEKETVAKHEQALDALLSDSNEPHCAQSVSEQNAV